MVSQIVLLIILIKAFDNSFPKWLKVSFVDIP